jgi:hypothetical protein
MPEAPFASVPVAHTPEVSLIKRPSVVSVLSTYEPTAVQLPTVGHEIALIVALGMVSELEGSVAFMNDHVLPDWIAKVATPAE